jgi:F0F1-type ATP synthase membrane subunit c/vacuolar-type H+-ATPase subunit K
MSTNDPASIERKISARLFVMRVVWAGISVSLLTFVLLSVLVLRPDNAGSPMLFWPFLGLSVFLVALSFPIKQKALAQAIQAQDETQRAARFQTGYIVAWALCEAGGLFGLLARVITGSPYYYLSFIVAAFGMFAHFPGRERLTGLYFSNRF